MTKKKTERKREYAGRPTRYKAEYAEQARKLCLLGYTDEDLAGFWGVTEKTINNWKHAHPEFLQSLTRGKDMADADVAEALYQRALGYSHKAVKIMQHEGVPIEVDYTERYAPDTKACAIWLSNRQRKRWAAAGGAPGLNPAPGQGAGAGDGSAAETSIIENSFQLPDLEAYEDDLPQIENDE